MFIKIFLRILGDAVFDVRPRLDHLDVPFAVGQKTSVELLTDLSELVPISTTEQPNGAINVRVLSTTAVVGNRALPFEAIVDPFDPEATTNLEVKVESDATLNSCGNAVADIYGIVPASSTAKFLGDGYTCDQDKVVFTGLGAGNVDKPTCQACPP